eukprot:661134-Pleurochrysis_carterae.AAC.1
MRGVCAHQNVCGLAHCVSWRVHANCAPARLCVQGHAHGRRAHARRARARCARARRTCARKACEHAYDTRHSHARRALRRAMHAGVRRPRHTRAKKRKKPHLRRASKDNGHAHVIAYAFMYVRPGICMDEVKPQGQESVGATI